jgi:hypothetical protein
MAIILYLFVSWWAATAVLMLLILKSWKWWGEFGNGYQCKFRNQNTRDKINELVAILKRGGFDEPTVIRQLEILDVKNPPPPKLVHIYGVPYLMGSNKTGSFIQEHAIQVPDVLYALLRLPRRNVQNEIASKVFSLDERKRDELTRRWHKFVDPMLKYDELQAHHA